MNAVIGDIFPLAVVIAASPIPIVATILMLLSERARASGSDSSWGWLAGILLMVVVLSAFASFLPDRTGSSTVGGVVKILLGIALVVLGMRKWTARPGGTETVPAPGWMATVDSMTGARALGFGLVLAVANPKNILLALTAALAIGSNGLTLWQESVATLVFVAVAAASVAIPVVTYLVASAQMMQPLEAARSWLIDKNAVVIAVQSMVIGAVIVGAGIAAV